MRRDGARFEKEATDSDNMQGSFYPDYVMIKTGDKAGEAHKKKQGIIHHFTID